MKIASIYVDRVGKALAKLGINLKRAKHIEIAAAAFGFHNSNEFAAAAKRGDLTPPHVQPIGKVALPDGQSLIVVVDTLANAAYGVDESFIEQVVEDERAEKIGITPYGHLAWLADIGGAILPNLAQVIAPDTISSANQTQLEPDNAVLIDRETLRNLIGAAESYSSDLSSGLEEGVYDDDDGLEDIERAIEVASQQLKSPATAAPQLFESDGIYKLQVYTASISHKHGTNSYSALSEEILYAELAGYCEEYWSEVAGRQDVPASPAAMSDREIVDTYFEAHDDEYLELGKTDLALPSNLLPSLAATSKDGGHGTVGQSKNAASKDHDRVIWLTDDEGDPTFDAAATQPAFDRLNLSYSKQDGEFLPLTEREFEIVRARTAVNSCYNGGWSFQAGCSALYRREKFHSIEIPAHWSHSTTEGRSRLEAIDLLQELRTIIEPAVQALGGHILIELDAADARHDMQILLPFTVAERATTLDDYFDAIDYLINGTPGPSEYRKQVIATFRPQAWIRDYAMPVDPEGDPKFDVTFDLLLMGSEDGEKIRSNDYARDDLRYAHTAPEWIQNWRGPFEVDIDQSDVDALFKIVR